MLLRVTCVCWLIIRFLSQKVWLIGERTYPVIPALDCFEDLPAIVHLLSYYISVLCIIFLIVWPRCLTLITLLLASACFSAIIDVITWQPWEYQFIFTVIIFSINRNNARLATNAFIFLIASIYIYSGLAKFNGGFLYSVWEGMLLKDFLNLNPSDISSVVLHYAGLSIPFIETLGGVGLLLMRQKRLPALLMIAMHLFLIIVLSNVGLNYNSIVLPWNIALAVLLHLLFIQNESEFSIRSLVYGRNLIVFIFWGILPALNFIGYWPGKFSSSLYSGRTQFMVVCFSNDNVPGHLDGFVAKNDRYNICSGNKMLPLSKWAMDELSVLPLSEQWYYRKLQKKFNRKYPDADTRFFIYSYPFREYTELK